MDDIADIKRLLAENRKDLVSLKADVEKIRKQLVWNRIASILRVLIFIVPIILGFIYLFPVLDQVIKGYQVLVEQIGQPGADSGTPSLNPADPAFQDVLRRLQN